MSNRAAYFWIATICSIGSVLSLVLHFMLPHDPPPTDRDARYQICVSMGGSYSETSDTAWSCEN